MFSIVRIEQQGQTLHLTFGDQNQYVFPLIYLRDNDPARLHPNGQRLEAPSALDLEVNVIRIVLRPDGSEIKIVWPDRESNFSAQWLWHHRLHSSENSGSFTSASVLWDKKTADLIPTFDFGDLHLNSCRFDWLSSIVNYGVGLLTNVPTEPEYLLKVIRLFGYPRETNYGTVFNVRTTINPNNLAFTNHRISPHTDNPYRHPVPTLQVLHCLSASSTGGDSILVDGFKVAHDLRRKHPAFFNLLASTHVRFCFRDANNWLEYRGPIFRLDAYGELQSIRYNSRSIQPFELKLEDMISFYQAYLCWSRMVEEEEYALSFHMKPGDLYIVNNERILHARTAFGEKEGERWLQGAYSDTDGLLSSCRLLSEQLQENIYEI